MTWRWAEMDNRIGVSKAQLAKLSGSRQIIVGTFRGSRPFHDQYQGTTRQMTYGGMAEHNSGLFRVRVLVDIRIHARSAKFKSAGFIQRWENVEDD